MKMIEIFEKKPTRRISRVVMIDQHEEPVIRTEVEEYVVTEQIRGLLQDFVDQFLETRMGRVSDVCTWISGFFGSGKSHLAKMLGYILANREVTFEDSSKVEVAEYFNQKHGLKGTGILSKELKTKVFFYNMLKFDRARDEDLSRYVYRSLLRDLDYSEIPWVAEVERTLKEEGIWKEFVKTVKDETGKTWEEVRRTEVMMRPALVKALTVVKPETYPNLTIAQQAVEDQRRELILGTERLSQRLVEEAVNFDKEQGRVALILDEVGLYLRSTGASGLTELNSLAEDLEKIGNGKVWLVATAQEALERVAPEIGARRDQIGWLQDRFPIKYSLAPENIPTVVNQRLLAKDRTAAAFKELKKLYDENGGQLALATTIQNPAHDEGFFSRLDYESFSESYPLLPYHIPVMIDIFARLRAKGRRMGQETKLAGRERAVLSVVQSILLELIERDAQVSTLATFDLLYDAIDSVLKIVSADENSLITERIAQLGKVKDLEVSSVAKALFLLQQIEDWIPTTLNNISAVLYPKLGVDPSEHLEKVEKALGLLIKHRWVREEEGKYRFLSEVERSFEEEVNDALQLIRSVDVESRVVEIASDVLKNLKKYNHKKIRVFDTHLFVDEKEISRGGHLKLQIYTPFWASRKDNAVEDVYYESLGKEDVVFWVSKVDEGFTGRTKRLIVIEKVLDDWAKRARTPRELGELESYRREVASIKDDLPQLLDSALKTGTILFYGTREELKGQESITDIFQRSMKQLTEQKFPRFDEGAVNVPKDEIVEAILKWRGGHLPPAYKELKLIDAQQRSIVTNGPVAHAILTEVKRLGEITGSEIAEHFGGPPYGWDERVVRTVLAALFKNGSVQAEPSLNSSFVVRGNFRKAVFSVGVALTNKEKKRVRKFISEKFGVDAGITTEQISKTIETEAQKKLETIRDLTRTDGYHRLPYTDEVDSLERALRKLMEQASPSLRVKALLDPEILESLDNHLPVLQNLIEFMEGERLQLYLTMRKFAEAPLSNIMAIDPSLEEKASVFTGKLTGKSLLIEWGAIYDRFRELKEKHKAEYIAAHDKCQHSVHDAIDGLKQWAKKKKIEPSHIQKAVNSLESFGCTAGEKGDYDETTFSCKVCRRTVSIIHNAETLVKNRLDEEKGKLIALMAEREKPLYDTKISSTKRVRSNSELKSALEEVSEFAKYWITQGKKVRLKVEGETESG
jgi:hypothetical protein